MLNSAGSSGWRDAYRYYPPTLTGIEKYLDSGLVKGIGPVMAKRVVAMFGLETLDIIEDTQRQ